MLIGAWRAPCVQRVNQARAAIKNTALLIPASVSASP
jgi:hypothetical protein